MATGITPATQRALEIVAKYPNIYPSFFARMMWPDSDHLDESYRAGPNASVRGRGLTRAAGGYLGRLRKRGLVYRGRKKAISLRHGVRWFDGGYAITTEGERQLRAAIADHGAVWFVKVGQPLG